MTDEIDQSRRNFLKTGAKLAGAAALSPATLLAESAGPVFDISAEWHALHQQNKSPSEGQGTLTPKEFSKFREVLDAYNNITPYNEREPNDTTTLKFIKEVKSLNNRRDYTEAEAAHISGRLIYEGAKEGIRKKGMVVDVAAISDAAKDMLFKVTDKPLPLETMLKNGMVTRDSQYNIPAWGAEEAANVTGEITYKKTHSRHL